VEEPPGRGGAPVGHAVRYLLAVPLSPVFGGRGNDSGGTNAAAPTADAALGGLSPVTRAPNTLGGKGTWPRTTRTWCVMPSSASGIAAMPSGNSCPSSSDAATPRLTPCGFSTTISYLAE